MEKCPKIDDKTKLDLSRWLFNKLREHLQGLKALRQKEKTSKSAQVHVPGSITDVVTVNDVSEVSSEVISTVDTES